MGYILAAGPLIDTAHDYFIRSSPLALFSHNKHYGRGVISIQAFIQRAPGSFVPHHQAPGMIFHGRGIGFQKD